MSDVALVSMPFGPVFSPSLALSLLKGGLAREGTDASLHYFTIRFAEAVGQRFYCDLANEGQPALEDLPGEWLFSSALFGTRSTAKPRYVDRFLRGYYSDSLIARILRARDLVPAFLDRCLASILREAPRVVGFTSIFQQHTASLALARRLKRVKPAIFIVLGGANCEGVMGAETVRSFPFVDAVISGEADVVFPELVARVLSGKSISSLPGVRSRESVEKDFATGQFSNAPAVPDMDRLPAPDYRDYFEQFKASRYDREWLPTLFLETARGCWWGERMHCTFCGLNGASMAFRSKSSARVLAEVSGLLDTYPGCDIQVVDNILDLRYFKDVIPALAAYPVKPRLFWETKSNLKREQVRSLREAGVREIQPGIESLSDAVLKLMRKGVSALQNIQVLKWCREFGIDARWNLLWGFPGEPPEEYARTATLIPALAHLEPPVAHSTIRLDRFSPNFFDAERFGFQDVQPLPAYRHVYRVSNAAVANLAYYFTYRYREPRDVDDYVRPLARQLEKWKRLKSPAALLSVQAGDHLVLIDLRPVNSGPFVVLAGAAQALYRECNGVHDIWQLARSLTAADGVEVSSQSVEELLAPLVERNLLLRDGSRYLALAIPVGEYVPPPTVDRAFAAAVKRIGRRTAGRSWTVPTARIGTSTTLPDPRPRRRADPKGRRHGARRLHLTSCSFSIDARGRLVIKTSERPRQNQRSH